jgi:hypothetical protein
MVAVNSIILGQSRPSASPITEQRLSYNSSLQVLFLINHGSFSLLKTFSSWLSFLWMPFLLWKWRRRRLAMLVLLPRWMTCYRCPEMTDRAFRTPDAVSHTVVLYLRTKIGWVYCYHLFVSKRKTFVRDVVVFCLWSFQLLSLSLTLSFAYFPILYRFDTIPVIALLDVSSSWQNLESCFEPALPPLYASLMLCWWHDMTTLSGFITALFISWSTRVVASCHVFYSIQSCPFFALGT